MKPKGWGCAVSATISMTSALPNPPGLPLEMNCEAIDVSVHAAKETNINRKKILPKEVTVI